MLLRIPRYALIALFSTVSLLAVTACSPDSNNLNGTASPPPAAGAAQQEIKVAPIPSAMDTFRALAPPDGLKFTPLFNDGAPNVDARLKRLEDAVQQVRNDVDTLVPTMVRMVAIEKDIKGLVAQLQTITEQNQGLPPALIPAETPTSKSPPPLPVQPVEAEKKATESVKPIPGEGVAKGTEPAKAVEAEAAPTATSLLVTPEAAPKGELPPEGAASPYSKAPAPEIKPAVKPEAKKPVVEKEAKAAPVAAPPPAPKAAPEPVPAPLPKPLPKPAPKAAAQGTVGDVVNMRIADMKDRTQLTLDVTADASVPVEMEGKNLIIDLKHFNWLGADKWQADHRKLINGGQMKNGKLYIDLKSASDFGVRKLLPPSGNEKNYRLVIDLYKK